MLKQMVNVRKQLMEFNITLQKKGYFCMNSMGQSANPTPFVLKQTFKALKTDRSQLSQSGSGLLISTKKKKKKKNYNTTTRLTLLCPYSFIAQ